MEGLGRGWGGVGEGLGKGWGGVGEGLGRAWGELGFLCFKNPCLKDPKRTLEERGSKQYAHSGFRSWVPSRSPFCFCSVFLVVCEQRGKERERNALQREVIAKLIPENIISCNWDGKRFQDSGLDVINKFVIAGFVAAAAAADDDDDVNVVICCSWIVWFVICMLTCLLANLLANLLVCLFFAVTLLFCCYNVVLLL